VGRDSGRGKSKKKPAAATPVRPAAEPPPAEWTVEVWEDDHGHAPFVAWFDKLDQYEQAVVDAVIEQILVPLGMDVCATEWGKALGDGLYEVRIRRPLSAIRTWGKSGALVTDEPGDAADDDPSVDEAPGMADRSVLLRIFCTFHGSKVVLLFQGYDKGADASEKRQQREIRSARRHLKAWRAQQRRE